MPEAVRTVQNDISGEIYMTKDILVRVRGVQTIGEEEDTVEMITPGTYYVKNGKQYLIYDESLDETGTLTHNTVKVMENRIEVMKRGLVESHMIFEPGRRTTANYRTPMGLFLMGITTSLLEVEEDEESILLRIKYSMEMNGEIALEVSEYKGIIKNKKIRNMPILRGVFSFIESLYLGVATLTFSASFFEEEETDQKEKTKKQREKKVLTEEQQKRQDSLMMGGTVAFSIVLAVAIFMILPYYISVFFQKFTDSYMLIAVLEGLIRLAIFIGYVAAISLMPDIKRVYMYHGAEHKCINCIEHGMDLTVENVRKSSRLHKRCVTSFLLIVMIISIFFFMFIHVDSRVLRLVLRLVLIPVIAGVSFEFIRLAGRSDNALINLLSKPGLLLQHITTKEPEDDMIEVGIASVEAVFDWKTYVEEIRQEDSREHDISGSN